ncbi:MAG: cation:proton antiporter [Candidatus Hydrogenedentes bacterium]|nr:cation:proton antiporter [Candidatus Hydrogenedentota bacterium]
MHHPEFLTNAVILFGTGLVVSWAFRRLNAPAVIGYLMTGMIIGPSSFQLIEEEQVNAFAEIGLVLLLFTVGLELSPKPLLASGLRLVLAAAGQIGLTAAVAGLASFLVAGVTPVTALITGIAVSLSSTAIVLKSLSDRGEIRTVMGNLSTGFLLLQDVFVIIVMMLIPLFAVGKSGEGWSGLIAPLAGLLGFGAGIAVLRPVLPRLLQSIVARGGSELTTLLAVCMAAGGATLADMAGFPLALGACVAGLILADADIRHQLVADIAPFRDVFNALFFISLGMLVNFDRVLAIWPWLLLAVLLTLLLKSLLTAAVVTLFKWPLRIGIQVGLGLCTVSEFGYVLAHEASASGLIDGAVLPVLIPYAVGTMIIGAMFLPLTGPIADRITRRVNAVSIGADAPLEKEGYSNHVIVVGYGISGQNLAKVLRATRIPHIIVEMNPTLAEKARQHGEEVLVGDATRMHILEEAGLRQARALIVAINDLRATLHTIAQARNHRPDLYILVRSHNVGELGTLYTKGADVVVSSDFEVSIKMFASVLTELHIPDNIIQAQIASVRAGGYGMLRGIALESPEQLQELMAVFRTTATQTWYINEEHHANGKSIAGLNLRAETGVSIIAVVRDGEPITNPSPQLDLHMGDVLVMVGTHAQLDAARKFLA